MNQTAIRALESALSNTEDNLYRYRAAERAKPGSVTGNDEPFVSVIASLEREADDLRRALEEVKRS